MSEAKQCEGSHCKMRETGVTVFICLCISAFFSHLLCILNIFFFTVMLIRSKTFLNLSPLFPFLLFLQHHAACLFHFLTAIHRSVHLRYLSISLFVCVLTSVHTLIELIFPAHPKTALASLFPPPASLVHLNVTN